MVKKLTNPYEKDLNAPAVELNPPMIKKERRKREADEPDPEYSFWQDKLKNEGLTKREDVNKRRAEILGTISDAQFDKLENEKKNFGKPKTESNQDRFLELARTEQQGRLTPEQQAEFVELREKVAGIKPKQETPEPVEAAAHIAIEPKKVEPQVYSKKESLINKAAWGTVDALYKGIVEPLGRNTVGKWQVASTTLKLKFFEWRTSKYDREVDKCQKDLAYLQGKLDKVPAHKPAEKLRLEQRQQKLQAYLAEQMAKLQHRENKRATYQSELAQIGGEIISRLEARMLPFTEQLSRADAEESRLKNKTDYIENKIKELENLIDQHKLEKKSSTKLGKKELNHDIKEAKKVIVRMKKRLKQVKDRQELLVEKVAEAKKKVAPHEEKLALFKAKINPEAKPSRHVTSSPETLTSVESAETKVHPRKYVSFWNYVAEQTYKAKFSINYQEFMSILKIDNKEMSLADLSKKAEAYMIRNKKGAEGWKNILRTVEKRIKSQ